MLQPFIEQSKVRFTNRDILERRRKSWQISKLLERWNHRYIHRTSIFMPVLHENEHGQVSMSTSPPCFILKCITCVMARAHRLFGGLQIAPLPLKNAKPKERLRSDLFGQLSRCIQRALHASRPFAYVALSDPKCIKGVAKLHRLDRQAVSAWSPSEGFPNIVIVGIQ